MNHLCDINLIMNNIKVDLIFAYKYEKEKGFNNFTRVYKIDNDNNINDHTIKNAIKYFLTECTDVKKVTIDIIEKNIILGVFW